MNSTFATRCIVVLGCVCCLSNGSSAVAAAAQPGVWVSVDGGESLFFGGDVVFNSSTSGTTVQFADDGVHGVGVAPAANGHVAITFFDGQDLANGNSHRFQGGVIGRDGTWRLKKGEGLLEANFGLPARGECSGRKVTAPDEVLGDLPWVVRSVAVVICR